VKIGIVNDSVMAAEVLRRIVSSDEDHQIIWMAGNGAEAIMHCNHSLPDLILMDIKMPVMNGVEATRRIMKSTPCPILVVTATVTGNSSEVFEAMGAGAIDAVATPVVGTETTEDTGSELLRKIDLIGKLSGFKSKRKQQIIKVSEALPAGQIPKKNLIVIGSSTGGPQAFLEILSAFPVDVNAAIIVVQHMDKKFIAGLADWVKKQIRLPVQIIQKGDRPKIGTVMIPDTDTHLIMTSSATLCYSDTPTDNFYHPSVDVFFNSAAKFWHGNIIGVLLTGMGKDGAQGLLSIKARGCHTIAQDEGSSIVFGMPKAAIQLQAASEVLPLKAIGNRVLELIAGK
jgi:two-component system response regulator WspF